MLSVEIRYFEVIAALASGRLDEHAAADRARVERELAAIIEDWRRQWVALACL